jgi:N-acetylglutamate synthase-like GNAT family acetyltransferase
MSSRQIRDATIDDADSLAGLVSRSFRDVAERFGLTPENCPTHPSFCTPEWIRADFQKRKQYYLLSSADEGACGCVAIEQPQPDICYLERLAVLPESRRRGYGRALVEHVLAEARRRRAARVELAIIGEHHELQHWYERHGFTFLRTARFPHLPFTVAFLGHDL